MQITACFHFSLYLIWKMYAINLNNLIFLDVYFQDVSFCSTTRFEQAISKKKILSDLPDTAISFDGRNLHVKASDLLINKLN